MLSVVFITYLSFYLFWLTKSIFGLLTKFTKFVPLLITWWWVFSIYLVRSDVFLSQMITDDGQILVLIIIKLLTSSSDLSAICQNLSQFIIHPTNPFVIWKPTLIPGGAGIKKFLGRVNVVSLTLGSFLKGSK